jgi:serine/threonine protein kinase
MLGRLLRSSTYATARIVLENGELVVRKERLFYAPPLVWLGGLLVRLLDTGVRVLPQREWEEQERRMYETLYDADIRIDGSTLVLPCLAGDTLAMLLERHTLPEWERKRATELAAAALAALHRAGLTHGDAMAENVLIDMESGTARWFDFETAHDWSRPMPWRRADDVRALLSTCLVRTPRAAFADTVDLIVDTYSDEGVVRELSWSFSTANRRPLVFHLGQAPLSFGDYRDIDRILRARISA